MSITTDLAMGVFAANMCVAMLPIVLFALQGISGRKLLPTWFVRNLVTGTVSWRALLATLLGYGGIAATFGATGEPIAAYFIALSGLPLIVLYLVIKNVRKLVPPDLFGNDRQQR